jgi:hypothetical protein
MPETRQPSRTILVAFAAVALAACGGKDDASAANRQIELAPAKTAEPQLADAPLPKAEPKTEAEAPAPKPEAAKPAPAKAPPPEPEPQPKAEAPVSAPVVAAPAPAAPAPPPTGTVAEGTMFTVTPTTKICTNTHKTGDRFTASLASAVTGTNGVVIPAGATAIVRIVDAESPAARRDSAHLQFDILSIRVGDQTYEVDAHITQSAAIERVNTQSRTDQAKKVGAGAVIGAIAGRVLGGNTKGAVIGGAVGAAAGAAVAAGSNHYEGCLAGDGAITLALNKPLVIKLAGAP